MELQLVAHVGRMVRAEETTNGARSPRSAAHAGLRRGDGCVAPRTLATAAA
jgi:hypothetical protein